MTHPTGASEGGSFRSSKLKTNFVIIILSNEAAPRSVLLTLHPAVYDVAEGVWPSSRVPLFAAPQLNTLHPPGQGCVDERSAPLGASCFGLEILGAVWRFLVQKNALSFVFSLGARGVKTNLGAALTVENGTAAERDVGVGDIACPVVVVDGKQEHRMIRVEGVVLVRGVVNHERFLPRLGE